jgi:hypothetical protein
MIPAPLAAPEFEAGSYSRTGAATEGRPYNHPRRVLGAQRAVDGGDFDIVLVS